MGLKDTFLACSEPALWAKCSPSIRHKIRLAVEKSLKRLLGKVIPYIWWSAGFCCSLGLVQGLSSWDEGVLNNAWKPLQPAQGGDDVREMEVCWIVPPVGGPSVGKSDESCTSTTVTSSDWLRNRVWRWSGKVIPISDEVLGFAVP